MVPFTKVVMLNTNDQNKSARKSRMKQKVVKQQKILFRLTGGAVMLLAMVLVAGFSMPRVAADRFDEQIRDLQNQNSAREDRLASLRIEAAGYEDAIAKLKIQIVGLQQQINDNLAQQAELQRQIEEKQRELEYQRQVLGENIKVMYIEGQISTLEILATSKNLSDFVDKAEYRNAVRNKIQETLKYIAQLQNELKQQKNKVDVLLAEHRAQQAQLDYSRTEQSRLLGFNKSQQAAFNAEIQGNNKKIAELKAQQALENERLFGGGGGGIIGGGGYPWGNAKCIHTGQVDGKCPNYDWAVNGSIWNWETGGYGYRNCTDWVSYRVRSTGRYVPAGLGHAKQWDDRRSYSTSPSKGDAAVSNAGEYGHVMYVESVDADGTIFISDYNRAGTGKYSTARLERVSEGRYRNTQNGAISNLTFVSF